MAGENTLTTLNGLFKRIYADTLEEIRPRGYKLANDVAFAQRKKLGDTYEQPVLIAHEHGVTYAKSGSGAFTLNAPIAGTVKNASVQGANVVIRSRIGYEEVAKATSGGEQAFRASFDLVVENMTESLRKRREISLFYGKAGLGIVNTANNTNNTVTIKAAEWAPGIWSGMEGAKVVFWSASGNTTHSPAADASAATISSIDFQNRKLTLSSIGANVTSGDLIYFNSQRATTGSHNDFDGLHNILTNTGTLFSISAATYSLWQATSVAAGGALTFATVNDAVAAGMAKGLENDVTLYINPEVWSDLIKDEASRARHPEVGRYDLGTDEITYYSQNGTIKIKASNYVKLGYGYMIQPAKFLRLGATDITFNLLGKTDEFFKLVEDAAGYEMRAYYHQALFSYCPGQAVVLTGITS